MTESNSSSSQSEVQAFISCFAMDYLREQKRKRFWRWLMRLFVLAFILGLAYQVTSSRSHRMATRSAPHVGLINIKGMIADLEQSSANSFAKSLHNAYKSSGLKALVIQLNTPGGSPVQADYMYSLIKHYHGRFPKVKIYAVCVDMCASAGYYIAAAADEIYANPSSLVGSIGVLYNGFGFVDTLEKLGMTRRLVTAGKNKGFMDPFSPIDNDQEKEMKTMLDIIHQQFIEKVKAGRGSRLVLSDDLFSGLFWTGVQAKERGLIDGYSSTGQLARDVVKVDKVINYSYKENMLEKLTSKMGASIAKQIPEALQGSFQ